jgi:hypothetical protein
MTWDRSKLHRIERYEEGLEHVGLTILLSDITNWVGRIIKLESVIRAYKETKRRKKRIKT